MQKILTLSVSAMALAALVAASSGCTGDDDDDDAGGPGGIVVLALTSGGLASPDYSYAEFYSDYVGDFTSLRDIPIGACVDYASLGGGTAQTPTYLDVGATVTAAGAASVTYNRTVDGTDITYGFLAEVTGATPGDYDVTTADLGDVGTITVPALPANIATGVSSITWTSANADDAFIIVAATDFAEINLCHSADNGSFTIPASLGLTSGLAAVSLANYGEASFEGRTVVLVGQAGDPSDFQLWAD